MYLRKSKRWRWVVFYILCQPLFPFMFPMTLFDYFFLRQPDFRHWVGLVSVGGVLKKKKGTAKEEDPLFRQKILNR